MNPPELVVFNILPKPFDRNFTPNLHPHNTNSAIHNSTVNFPVQTTKTISDLDLLTSNPTTQQVDSRLSAPFDPKTKKAMTVLTHSNLTIKPGLKREDIKANSVFIGTVNHPNFKRYRHLPCATGLSWA